MPEARVTYEPDDNGQLQAVVWGTDAYGNPVMVDQSAPWYRDVILAGVNTAGSIFGGQRRYDGYYAPGAYGQGANLQTQVSPGGFSTGFNLSSNTLVLIGLGIFIFLYAGGRKGRG